MPLFVLVSPRGGSKKIVTTITARATAPAFAHEDMFVDDPGASTLGS